MKKFIFFVVIFCLIGVYSVDAYVASSTNYRIQFDSLNIGGARSTSTNYIIEDTIGEISTGESTSASYKLKAGYQQMSDVYLALSASFSIVMSPNIGGVSGGTSNGSGLATVTTDSSSGYSLSIKASASPAMATSSYSFADYTTVAANTPDYTWLITATTSEFGFTPEGDDIVQKFKDNSSACATGTNETNDKCWYNFSTSDETISSIYSANHPLGTATTIKFRAESGNQHLQVADIYQAAITITAVSN